MAVGAQPQEDPIEAGPGLARVGGLTQLADVIFRGRAWFPFAAHAMDVFRRRRYGGRASSSYNACGVPPPANATVK